MSGPKALAAAVWVVLCLTIAACSPELTGPPVTPSPVQIEIPVTVEVTRVVTQHVVVQPTPTPPAPCVPASLDATATITIGAILPFSSPQAMLGAFGMQAALNLAVQDLNQAGGIAGRPVHLISYDSAGDADQSGALAHRLIVNDCAVGIVGFYYNDDARAALEVAHSFGTPVIIAHAPADALTASEYPEVFRVSPTTGMAAQMPARWLHEVGDVNQDGQTRATVIAGAMTSPDFQSSVEAAFAAAGIASEFLTVDLPTGDFSPTIARIVARDALPDAIFIYIKDADALALQAQLLAAGIGPRNSTLLVQQYAGLDSSSFWTQVPEGVGTVVARMGPWPPTVTARGQGFALDYAQFSGHWPEAYAFAAYDALYLLADAVKRAASPQGAALVVALEETQAELAAGAYFFPYGSLNPPGAEGVPGYLWHQWPDAQALYLQYTEPQQPASEMAVLWPDRYHTVDMPVVR